jgi:phospholipase/carboxylesterase
MSSGRVFRFGPGTSSGSEHRPRHLFVFLHGCGATAQSMIPIAFKFQARFPSAALVVPSGFDPDAHGGAAQDWYPTRGLNCDNHGERVASVLPDLEDLGHALSHRAISLGSLRLLQGIYEGRRATIH